MAKPKTQKFILNSIQSVREFIITIKELWSEHKFLRVSVMFGKDRSLQQNALLHKWFGEIAEQSDDRTPTDVKIECSRKFFIPILRAEDEAFNELIRTIAEPLKNSAEAMDTFIYHYPITSACTVKQMTNAMDQIFYHYTADGKELTTPEEEGL